MVKADQLIRDMRAGDGGGTCGVIGRRYFDHIAADHVDARQIAQHCSGLPRMQSAPDRGARAGGNRWVKRIYIERYISRLITDNGFRLGHGGGGADFVHLARINEPDTQIIIGGGADTDLN